MRIDWRDQTFAQREYPFDTDILRSSDFEDNIEMKEPSKEKIPNCTYIGGAGKSNEDLKSEVAVGKSTVHGVIDQYGDKHVISSERLFVIGRMIVGLCVRKYGGQGFHMESMDLLNQSVEAMLKLMVNYDPSRGDFEKYLLHSGKLRVLTYINRVLRRNEFGRDPLREHGTGGYLKKMTGNFDKYFGDTSLEMMQEDKEMSLETEKNRREFARKCLALLTDPKDKEIVICKCIRTWTDQNNKIKIMTNAAIAQHMGIAESSVHNRIATIMRRRLESILDEEEMTGYFQGEYRVEYFACPEDIKQATKNVKPQRCSWGGASATRVAEINWNAPMGRNESNRIDRWSPDPSKPKSIGIDSTLRKVVDKEVWDRVELGLSEDKYVGEYQDQYEDRYKPEATLDTVNYNEMGIPVDNWSRRYEKKTEEKQAKKKQAGYTEKL